MRPLNWILDDAGEPVPCDDTLEWAKWYERSREKRIVKQTNVGDQQTLVSTVFLGIDHSWSFSGPPLLFETMIFGGLQDGAQRRYSTRAAALVGHEEMVTIALRAAAEDAR